MKHQRWRDALEADGGGWSRQNLLEVEVNRVSTHWRQSEQSELVRTCQELLLLHVGPNGDGFGGQAFMEHYNVVSMPSGCKSTGK
jgi:hypothetical protein